MKDRDAFKNKSGTCYTPENGDTIYTYQDYLQIAKGNEKIAAMIFDLSDWQHPETIFEEGIREGEWTEEGVIIPQE